MTDDIPADRVAQSYVDLAVAVITMQQRLQELTELVARQHAVLVRMIEHYESIVERSTRQTSALFLNPN